MGQPEPVITAGPGVPRHGWRRLAQTIVIAVIAVAAAAAVYTERRTMHSGMAALAHVRPEWIVAGFAAEFVSMAAFALLQRRLLSSGSGAAGLTLRSVLAAAYGANAIAVAVPVAGSGLAAGYAYREFRRHGVPPEQVSVALTVAGALSTVTFTVLAVCGALVSGNLVAGLIAGAGGLAGAAAAACVLLALRYPRPRRLVTRTATVVLRACRRVIRRPRSDPSALVAGALERAGAVRLGWRHGTAASWWALLNWTADAGCLVCALLAAGAPVPWRQLLLIWCAGAGAASFCPVPAGLGVVDIVLISALAATGLPAPRAVAVVLLYRIITFKIAVTSVWLICHHISARRQGPHLASSPTEGTAGIDGEARAR